LLHQRDGGRYDAEAADTKTEKDRDGEGIRREFAAYRHRHRSGVVAVG
jgi:hypothetical protein